MKVVRINAIWCNGCLVMKKIWKEVEKEVTNLETVDLDYDMDEEEALTYNPGDILPVNIFYKDGVEVKRLIGEVSKEEILKVLNEEN